MPERFWPWVWARIGELGCVLGWHRRPLQSALCAGVGMAHRCTRCWAIVRWTLYGLD